MIESDTPAACSACGGTGFVLLERDGQCIARSCACRSDRAARPVPLDLSLARAGVPTRFRECDFDHFHDLNLSLQQAKQLSMRYTVEFGDRDTAGRGMLLIGPPGVGKTHLAVSILRRLLADGKIRSGFFCETLDMIRQLQSSPESGLSRDDILEPVLMSDLLILDDLGGRMPSPWVEEILLQITNARYNERKPMIVTSNCRDDSTVPAGMAPAGTETERSAPSREWMQGSRLGPDGTKSGMETAARSGRPEREKDKPSLLTQRWNLSDRVGARVRSRLHEMCKTVMIESGDYRHDVLGKQNQWNPVVDADEDEFGGDA